MATVDEAFAEWWPTGDGSPEAAFEAGAAHGAQQERDALLEIVAAYRERGAGSAAADWIETQVRARAEEQP